MLVGASIVFRTFMPGRWIGSEKSKWDGKRRMSRHRRAYTVLFGAVGGYLVGMTSIGSGSVMAIIMLLLYPMSPAAIVGTDIAHATVLSLVTGLAHLASGNVAFGLILALLAGGIPGVLIGSRVSPLIPGRPLKVGLAAMLVVGGQLLIGG